MRTKLRTLGLLESELGSDAKYDGAVEKAVRAFQQRRGLLVTGVVDAETYRTLAEARWSLGDRLLSYSVSTPLVGDDVKALQERLAELGYDTWRADGVFGAQTERAVIAFQRDSGVRTDGRCGPQTLTALRRLGRRVVGGRPQLLRETVRITSAGPALVGKRVVLDPGHGGDDPGVTCFGVAEADVVWDLAYRLEGRLGALGVTTFLTRGRATTASERARCQFANSTDADLVISLHCDAASSRCGRGVATFYFGAGCGVSSTVGERLAGLVQREIVARTGLLDCRTHPKTLPILRLTRMPAVRVEAGYLTNETDSTLLAQPAFRDTVAEAVLVAVQRLYLPAESDPATGAFSFAERVPK